MLEQLKIVYRPIKLLKKYAKNSKTHSKAQIKQIQASMKQFGWTSPCLIQPDDTLIAGHGRVEAADGLGIAEAPCIVLEGLSENQVRALVIADNKIGENGGWDLEKLSEELSALAVDGFDATLTGFNEAEITKLLEGAENSLLPDGEGSANLQMQSRGAAKGPTSSRVGKRVGALAEKFMVAPFTVLDARAGEWIERKRAWIALGLKRGVGRKKELVLKGDAVTGHGGQKYRKEKGLVREDYEAETVEGTSLFDPVLAELMYKWFCPPGGDAMDLMCGDAVRGVVAGKLGIKYTGIDIRKEQIDSNISQGMAICPQNMPIWICGDAVDMEDLLPPKQFDFFFGCPPYAGLERYSDLPGDLSNMSYNQFMDTYRIIIKRGVERLKHDRFACFVVGDVRDSETGIYCKFVKDTIQAFTDAGMDFYNDAVLITQAGSLPLRAARQMEASRKLGKTHQNVLVFVKGKPKEATKALGKVDVSDVLDVQAQTEE